MNLKKSTSKTDAIVERMRQIRSSGLEDAVQLHEDAKRLVDWKSYVRTKPFLSIAVAALIGFAAFRKGVVAGQTKSTGGASLPQPTYARLHIPNAWRSRAIAVVSQFVAGTLKKYLLNLVQREVLERTSHDRSPTPSPKSNHSGPGSSTNGKWA